MLAGRMNALLDGEVLTALLRLVAVPVLLLGEIYVAKPYPTQNRFIVVLGAFAAYAVITLAVAQRLPERWSIAFVGCDVVFAGLLSYTSGGGYSQLRLAFLFPMVTAAFRYRPVLTASVTGAAIAAYVLQALTHPSAKSLGDADSFIVIQVAYIAWIGSALTLLSWLLAHREQAVRMLARQRQRLVAEAISAEERERQRLAEELHDNAIQNLLAARRDLAVQASDDPGGREGRAFAAVVETLGQLRATVADLHPHLLEQAGLAPAVGNTARRISERGGFGLTLDLDGCEPGPNERVLLRSATELLANVERHAHAHRVTLRLATAGAYDTLIVSDDGVGFDLATTVARVRPGHIGLLSLRERAEALGGSLLIQTGPGKGTVATLSLPRERTPEQDASLV
jgi:two-component system NarL family sensor kinase